MTKIMIGQIQFRQVGGGGGADPAGLSPGGGGFACLLMAAPCDAQYARSSRRDRKRTAPWSRHGADMEQAWSKHSGNQDRRAVEAARLEVAQGLVGGVQRVRVDGDGQLMPGRETQELRATWAAGGGRPRKP